MIIDIDSKNFKKKKKKRNTNKKIKTQLKENTKHTKANYS